MIKRLEFQFDEVCVPRRKFQPKMLICSWTDMAVVVKRLYLTVILFQSLESWGSMYDAWVPAN